MLIMKRSECYRDNNRSKSCTLLETNFISIVLKPVAKATGMMLSTLSKNNNNNI